MKKNFTYLTIFCIMLLSATVFGQEKSRLGGAFHFVIPVSDFETVASTGFGFSGQYDFLFTKKAALTIEAGWLGRQGCNGIRKYRRF